MLLLLFSLFSQADVPSATITVTDTRYEEIYFEEPRVICDVPCSFEQDTSTIFVEANKKPVPRGPLKNFLPVAAKKSQFIDLIN